MENDRHDTRRPPPSEPSPLLQRIRALDRRDLKPNYTPFVLGSTSDEGATIALGGVVVGQAETSFVRSTLSTCVDDDGSPVFELLDLPGERRGSVSRVLRMRVDAVFYRKDPPRSPTEDDRAEGVSRRTAALGHLTLRLLSLGLVSKAHSDVYPVSHRPIYEGGTALAYVNRVASPYLGVISVGIHLHCYVVSPPVLHPDDDDDDGTDAGVRTPSIEGVWLAKRSASKSHHPSLWDTTAAGGQPHDLSLFSNAIKEAHEEAGVPEKWIRDAYPTAADGGTEGPPPPPPPVAIATAKPDGSCLKPSVYYSYDLCVPRGWTPRAVDGEVEEFALCSMEELREEVGRGRRLRPAMVAVLLDFMVRHGVVTGENEADVEELKGVMYGGNGDGGMYGIWR